MGQPLTLTKFTPYLSQLSLWPARERNGDCIKTTSYISWVTINRASSNEGYSCLGRSMLIKNAMVLAVVQTG